MLLNGFLKGSSFDVHFCHLLFDHFQFALKLSLNWSAWMQSQKWQNDLCLFPRQTIQYHSNPSLYIPTTNAKEAEVEWFYEELLELTLRKGVLFIIWNWNAKVGNQEIPGVRGKFGLGVQNKAGQRLTEFCQENSLVIANTLFQQHKRKLYTWTSPDGQYWNQIDYIPCSQRWRSCIQSDQELTVAQIMSSLQNSDLK